LDRSVRHQILVALYRLRRSHRHLRSRRRKLCRRARSDPSTRSGSSGP
jgi:hypothetical protein